MEDKGKAARLERPRDPFDNPTISNYHKFPKHGGRAQISQRTKCSKNPCSKYWRAYMHRMSSKQILVLIQRRRSPMQLAETNEFCDLPSEKNRSIKCSSAAWVSARLSRCRAGAGGRTCPSSGWRTVPLSLGDVTPAEAGARHIAGADRLPIIADYGVEGS